MPHRIFWRLIVAITYFFLTQLVISVDYFWLQGSVSDRA